MATRKRTPAEPLPEGVRITGKVEIVKLDKVQPNDWNPNRMTEFQVEATKIRFWRSPARPPPSKARLSPALDYDNFNDAVVVATLQGVVLAFNKAGERMFGWPKVCMCGAAPHAVAPTR